MTEPNVGDVAVLLAAIATTGALVSGLAGVIKGVAFPVDWQTGRAPMVLVLVLSALFVGLAAAAAGIALLTPGGAIAYATGVLTVYNAAIASHQTVGKVFRVATGTTVEGAPDEGARPGNA